LFGKSTPIQDDKKEDKPPVVESAAKLAEVEEANVAV
jgi:hypothetical protein